MSKHYIRLPVTALLAGVLAACAGPVTISDKHAKATRSNQLAQAVNPNAGIAKSTAPIGLDGQKAEQVIKAYREEKGKVEKVRLITDLVD